MKYPMLIGAALLALVPAALQAQTRDEPRSTWQVAVMSEDGEPFSEEQGERIRDVFLEAQQICTKTNEAPAAVYACMNQEIDKAQQEGRFGPGIKVMVLSTLLEEVER